MLEIEDAEHSMCHTQMLKTTEKLERTRKALDVAVDALKGIKALDDNGNYDIEDYDCQVARIITQALEQINEIKGGK